MPCGMAREFSSYGLNINIECSHRCRYCHAPTLCKMVHEGSYYETTRGKIHWGKDGGYHVVPAPPNGWDLN